MGQTLTNGIFLPNEGERNCYTGLADNWRAIDGYIGNYNVHVADAVIHVSQEDRDKWDAVDNKADASALTAHTGNTTIHVTAEDKSKWNTGVTQAYVLRYASVSLRSLVTVAFSALDNTDNLKVGDKVIDSGGELFSITAIDTQNSTFTIGTALIDLTQGSNVVHKSGNETISGNKTFSSINGVEPGALSLPDLNNGIDISGYFTKGTTSNTYTALVDGYISILTTSSTDSAIYWSDSNNMIGGNAYSTIVLGQSSSNRVTNITFPVNKGVSYIIVFKSVKAVVSAKFFPCLGNV